MRDAQADITRLYTYITHLALQAGRQAGVDSVAVEGLT